MLKRSRIHGMLFVASLVTSTTAIAVTNTPPGNTPDPRPTHAYETKRPEINNTQNAGSATSALNYHNEHKTSTEMMPTAERAWSNSR